ncbi:SWIM zinc finger family protein [soil metagenome]
MSPAAQFGQTWWGRAWVHALEGAGESYESRLPRGRTYARRGAVHEMSLHPGHIAARVVGQHGELYNVDIAVRKLSESEWEQVADAIAAKAVHLAALLDGELHPGIVDDALAVDVHLLPSAIDLRPDCSCPDWAEPCKHAAAVCYVVAAELDRDPFALFLLRGKTREELISLVRSRRAGAAGTTLAAEDPALPEGADAAAVWRGSSLDDPLAEPPGLVASRRPASGLHRPGRYTAWDADIPAKQQVDTHRVDALAIDAIERAWSMIVDGRPSGLAAGPRADLARRAAVSGWPVGVSELADLAGVTAQRLGSWAEAWQLAGDAGVAFVADDDAWSTDQQLLSEGRELLVETGHPRRSVALNYDSLRMSQSQLLVIGPDGRWYRLQGSGKHQDLRLVRPPSEDLRELVDPPV